MVKLIITLVAVTLFPSTTFAQQFYNGNDLHGFCINDDGRAAMFIAGVLDTAVTFYKNEVITAIPKVCLPEHGILTQSKDIVCQYLDNHPEFRHLSASSRVIIALSEAFPCTD